jgi:FtsP/CotA-like multicopper oxidase with cupredoxin domain
LPGGITTAIWGLAVSPAAEPQLPGPVLEAVAGDTLEITIYNMLSEPVSLVFPAQDLPPEPVFDASGHLVSLARFAPPGGSATYTFPASRPGTFRYEGGTSPERQVQMGLYGMLIVRPEGFNNPGSPDYHTAYGAGTGSRYDVEAVILLSELDTVASSLIAVSGTYNPLNYAPQYWLLNGRPYPDCLAPPDASTQPLDARIRSLTGQNILVRLVNGGFLAHTLSFQGGTVRVIAEDGWSRRNGLLDSSYLKNAVTMGPGQTCDLLYMPLEGESFIYDRELLHLVNLDEYPGGMMTLVDVRTSFPGVPPVAPSHLKAAVITPGQVELAWAGNVPDVEGFVIERRSEAEEAYRRIFTLVAGATSFTDKNVQGNVSYCYHIFSFNAAGKSGYSNEAEIIVPPFAPPEAPTNLVAAAISTSEIELSWQDNSITEEGFRMERMGTAPDFMEIGRVGADITSYIDRELNPNTTCTYRVCAYNELGGSPYSNEASATTLNKIPDAPSNLVAKGISRSSIKITWTDNSTNEKGFILERRTVNLPFTEIARVGPNVTEYLDAALFRRIIYYYRVKAYNYLGISRPSNIGSAAAM